MLLSNGDALATKDGIGRGDMKEEVGQRVLQQKLWRLECDKRLSSLAFQNSSLSPFKFVCVDRSE